MKAGLVARLTAVFVTVFALSACSNGEQASEGESASQTVKGEVWYREKIALPDDALVHVYLEDVSLADAPAEVIAQKLISASKAPPYSFEFVVPKEQFKPNHRYALRARIEHKGKLLFTNDEFIDALSSDDGHRNVLVKKVVRAQPKLQNTRWKLVHVAGEKLQLGEQERPAYFSLNEENASVSGFNGCNGFNSTYTLKGTDIQFGMFAATMKMCAQGSDLEAQMMSILGNAKRYQIKGPQLSLLNEQGQTIGRFVAVSP
ncbi:YbaY family lipoprotein [Paraferrimonas haliotis]|uniref:DUF306 domain-containing protein n=1 Tax=Paraferrimonas haliotis TaxID=2013866 RepID=A0AA37WX51_9GAMM|nr:YbaY family lipoprotein [Paraferrimonas haliotis]GLS83059.1 hypothetical protein GCM10007894_10360 [Paraferrimonas haliotis]